MGGVMDEKMWKSILAFIIRIGLLCLGAWIGGSLVANFLASIMFPGM